MAIYEGFTIRWAPRAFKQLETIVKPNRKKITDKILCLVHNPGLVQIRKLKGFENVYRLKVGSYRVIFKVMSEKKELYVTRIGLRKHVYRNVEALA